eukprot:NODE_30553_length_194_cov_2.765517_g29383_i0.p3 GENE.NODE_30553_length_194_cov_2.765517_g29383_i0~~NODE_30553_length_194_cov_2.765517_g29383_i0.p3  ORF type:complete len:60 (+),score=2.40 NODE_30553_length_194_cov_2.765517_g29383_i0:2-181(+)
MELAIGCLQVQLAHADSFQHEQHDPSPGHECIRFCRKAVAQRGGCFANLAISHFCPSQS